MPPLPAGSDGWKNPAAAPSLLNVVGDLAQSSWPRSSCTWKVVVMMLMLVVMMMLMTMIVMLVMMMVLLEREVIELYSEAP